MYNPGLSSAPCDCIYCMTNVKTIEELAAAYHSGKASGEELEQLASMLEAGPETYESFKREIRRLEETAPADAEVDGAFDELMTSLEAPAVRKPRFTRIFAAAASVAAAAVLLLMLGTDRLNLGQQQNFISELTTSDRITVVTLPDSTRVTLFPGARLTQNPSFSARNRKVTLEGKAFFEVKSDPRHPFAIDMDGGSVEVIGTVFGLESASDDIRLTLLEGNVNFVTSSLERKIVPGESMDYDKENGSMRISHVDIDDYRAWMDGSLEYLNLGFADLVSGIGRIYGKEFIIDDALMAVNRQYTLRLSNHETLDEVMEMLAVLVPMTWEAVEDTIWLTKTTDIRQ